MNNNEILEKNTVDIKETKEREKQLVHKAGFIAACVGFMLTFIVYAFLFSSDLNISLLSESVKMIFYAIGFAFALPLSITTKRASRRVPAIVFASVMGVACIGCLARLVGGIIGMI